jgi:hypothetical protein
MDGVLADGKTVIIRGRILSSYSTPPRAADGVLVSLAAPNPTVSHTHGSDAMVNKHSAFAMAATAEDSTESGGEGADFFSHENTAVFLPTATLWHQVVPVVQVVVPVVLFNL